MLKENTVNVVLGVGDTIQENDEYYDMETQTWISLNPNNYVGDFHIGKSIDASYVPIRRKMTVFVIEST